jgi:hypothetical protein
MSKKKQKKLYMSFSATEKFVCEDENFGFNNSIHEHEKE